MAICKHCGTEIEDGLESCPNCGQKNTAEEVIGFFEPDEELGDETYNIFDEPEEFDLDELLSKEFQQKSTPAVEKQDLVQGEEEFSTVSQPEEEIDFAQMFGFSNEESVEELSAEPEETSVPEMEIPDEVQLESIDFSGMEDSDFLALDDLFQNLENDSAPVGQETVGEAVEGLEELLAVGAEEKQSKNSKSKKNKKETSFWQSVFGNVPVDPSKKKPEPTPEEIAAKKQKKKEEKKKSAEAKKEAANAKREETRKAKAEKEKAKQLAKEEKKIKKMQEAKQILEEMQDTRINRVGATIVFVFFAVCVIVLISGSDLFGYVVSVSNAEKSFEKALDNDVRYYNDAYNEIYGLEIRPEDQELNDKIMTVMFVNKELNSYNSFMVMENYEAALDALLKGLYRYGKYYDEAVPLGIDRDMDFVRTQILKELDATFDISEDEAEVLRSILESAMLDREVAKEYNLILYELVQESELLENEAEEE